jgi:gamma-glutamyl-gamma-aminobutyrate hydrolase PuuD
MPKVAVTYSPEVGGSSVISLKNAFLSVDCEIVDADYRKMISNIPNHQFEEAYKTPEGRIKVFAHAKFAAEKLLDTVDCLAISGNSAMIDPNLFNQERIEGQNYDFSRTIAELALVHVATQRGMPILGVCGGHQVVAVYGGGTIKDLNSVELDKQKFMNYDKIKFNVDSMLRQIFSQIIHSEAPLEKEFFGAHSQAVAELGRGFVKTAVSSDEQLIEAAESMHGAPVITTQFHPEITVHGLPNDYFLFQRNEPERENCLKIFDFFAQAGNTYFKRKLLANEIKETVKKIEEPSNQEEKIKIQVNEPKILNINKQEIKQKPVASIIDWIWNCISIFFDCIKSFVRSILSNRLTAAKVQKLQEQEKFNGIDVCNNDSTEKMKIQMQVHSQFMKIEESANGLLAAPCPAEIMINKPAMPWHEENEDEHRLSMCL